MHLLISCTDCKVLSVSNNSCISRSVFCDVSRVLTWIPSAKDESIITGTVSISKSVNAQV